MTGHLANVREHYEIYQDDVLDIGCKVNNSFITEGILPLQAITGHYRNVRGLRKSMVVFCLFEKLRY